MFVAMNRFRIAKGREHEFEEVWRKRDSHLAGVPGFRSFALMRGPEYDDHTLYASHSIWDSRDAFDAWTRSDAFRRAHGQAGATKGIYLGHPVLETFEAVVM